MMYFSCPIGFSVLIFGLLINTLVNNMLHLVNKVLAIACGNIYNSSYTLSELRVIVHMAVYIDGLITSTLFNK